MTRLFNYLHVATHSIINAFMSCLLLCLLLEFCNNDCYIIFIEICSADKNNKKTKFVRWKGGCVQVVHVASIMTKAHYFKQFLVDIQ